MGQVGFSIRIESDMKLKLEELASLNFRTLNGEINKALDFYIKYGSGEFPMVQNVPVIEPPRPVIEPKTTETVLNTNNFGEDEVEEF